MFPFGTLRPIYVRRCAIDRRDTITLLSDQLFSTPWLEPFSTEPALMSADIKRRILLAAEAEFALRGFAGARVDDIATRARKSRNPTCTTTSTPSEHFLTV